MIFLFNQNWKIQNREEGFNVISFIWVLLQALALLRRPIINYESLSVTDESGQSINIVPNLIILVVIRAHHHISNRIYAYAFKTLVHVNWRETNHQTGAGAECLQGSSNILPVRNRQEERQSIGVGDQPQGRVLRWYCLPIHEPSNITTVDCPFL